MSDSSQLQVKMHPFPKGVVLSPQGEIGYPEATDFRAWLKKAYEANPQTLVVDLAGVTYMSTPGVATLVEALQAAKRGKHRLILCGMNDRVRAIFEIARLHTVFEILPDVEAATNA